MITSISTWKKSDLKSRFELFFERSAVYILLFLAYKTLRAIWLHWNWRIKIRINDIDFNELEISIKLPFGKQDFKYFIG